MLPGMVSAKWYPVMIPLQFSVMVKHSNLATDIHKRNKIICRNSGCSRVIAEKTRQICNSIANDILAP